MHSMICSDVNECNTANGGCNQICTNIIGSFVCSCNTGYELDSDQRTCVSEFKVQVECRIIGTQCVSILN